MAALLRQLIQLCLLRIGPQDLPYSPAGLASMVGGVIALQCTVGLALGLEGAELAPRVLVFLFMIFGVVALLLRRRGFGNRVLQTQLALVGTALFFALAMLPNALALLSYVDDKNPPASALMFVLAAFVLVFWKLRVDASIWRNAMELRTGPAYVLAVAMLLAEALLVRALVPVPGATAS